MKHLLHQMQNNYSDWKSVWTLNGCTHKIARSSSALNALVQLWKCPLQYTDSDRYTCTGLGLNWPIFSYNCHYMISWKPSSFWQLKLYTTCSVLPDLFCEYCSISHILPTKSTIDVKKVHLVDLTFCAVQKVWDHFLDHTWIYEVKS